MQCPRQCPRATTTRGHTTGTSWPPQWHHGTRRANTMTAEKSQTSPMVKYNLPRDMVASVVPVPFCRLDRDQGRSSLSIRKSRPLARVLGGVLHGGADRAVAWTTNAVRAAQRRRPPAETANSIAPGKMSWPLFASPKPATAPQLIAEHEDF